MKSLLQILLFFCTWANLSATPIISIVALPNYDVPFPKTVNHNPESELKICISIVARTGISETKDLPNRFTSGYNHFNDEIELLLKEHRPPPVQDSISFAGIGVQSIPQKLLPLPHEFHQTNTCNTKPKILR